jgi:hypothetical protein
LTSGEIESALRPRRVGGRARDLRRGHVHVVDRGLEAVVGLRDRRRREGVGLDDVGAGVEVRVVDGADDIGARQGQQIAVALELLGMRREALAAEVGLAELVRLDLRAHGAVDDEDALAQDPAQRRFDFRLVEPILTHDLCATAVMT